MPRPDQVSLDIRPVFSDGHLSPVGVQGLGVRGAPKSDPTQRPGTSRTRPRSPAMLRDMRLARLGSGTSEMMWELYAQGLEVDDELYERMVSIEAPPDPD